MRPTAYAKSMSRIFLFSLVAACGPSKSGDSTIAETGVGETTGNGNAPTTGLVSSETASSETTGNGTGEIDQYVAFFYTFDSESARVPNILIHKAELTTDLCTTVHLTRPGTHDFAITVPDMWEVEFGVISQGADNCLDIDSMPLMAPIGAIKGTGEIMWETDSMLECPQTIELDVKLDFPQREPWVPAHSVLQAVDLPLQGCK